MACQIIVWYYLSRTISGSGRLLQPLEDKICHLFPPAFTGRPPPSSPEWNLFSLPAGLEGIAFSNPAKHADIEYSFSVRITQSLTNAILEGNSSSSYEVVAAQIGARTEVASMKRKMLSKDAEHLKSTLFCCMHAVKLCLWFYSTIDIHCHAPKETSHKSGTRNILLPVTCQPRGAK